MAFDPSVIASIGDNTPDPAAAKAKAYSLADMIDQNQLNKGRLADDKQNRDDQQKVRQVLQSSDISTYEGKLKAGEQITKINPKMGMDFVKEANTTKGQQNQLTEQQLALKQSQMEVIGTSALALKDQHDKLIAAGKNEAEVNAAMGPQMLATIKQLESQTLPDGTPVLGANERQSLEQALGKGVYNTQYVDGVVANSKKAADAIKLHLDQRREDNTEAGTRERNRHDDILEKQGQEKIDVSRDKVKDGKFTDQQGGLLGALAELGVALPAGMRSKSQQIATLQSLIDRNPGISADEIAHKVKTGQIQFSSEKTEAGVVARKEGSTVSAVTALNREGGLYDQLLETAGKVDFGDNKVKNDIRLGLAGKFVSDPDIREYVNTLTDARAELAGVLSKGGQMTDATRAAAEHALPDNMGLGELKAAVSRSKKVAAAIEGGNEDVQRALASGTPLSEVVAMVDKKPGAKTPAAGTATVPPPPAGFVVQQ